jgi:hypothetical protein
MQAMKRRRSIMLGVLLLAFAGAWMTGACGSDAPMPVNGIECPVSMDGLSVGTAAATDACPTPCSAEVEKPCKRFKIQLQGDPNNNIETRRKYKAAFRSACYMSAGINGTFNCFYKKVEGKGQACEHAQKVAEVFGAAPYAEGYTCKEVPGTNKENYTLQVGPDPAHVVDIDLLDAPLQDPLIEVDAVPTIAVNGPYRNLPEPQVLGPGEDFSLKQKELILKANRDANGGKIRSDLAGFVYPCDKTNPSKMCTEPDFLIEGSSNDADAVQVHHVMRKNDERCCAWGTNSNANAAVISRKLNRYLWYRYPTAAEVLQINQVTPYSP